MNPTDIAQAETISALARIHAAVIDTEMTLFRTLLGHLADADPAGALESLLVWAEEQDYINSETSPEEWATVERAKAAYSHVGKCEFCVEIGSNRIAQLLDSIPPEHRDSAPHIETVLKAAYEVLDIDPAYPSGGTS